MASGGWSSSPGRKVPFQAQGAEYGIPSDVAVAAGPDGSVTVKIHKDVAERFNKLTRKSIGGGEAGSVDTHTHKSGMEPETDRARNLTAVTQAKVQSEGTAEHRTPDVGFPEPGEPGPDRPNIH